MTEERTDLIGVVELVYDGEQQCYVARSHFDEWSVEARGPDPIVLLGSVSRTLVDAQIDGAFAPLRGAADGVEQCDACGHILGPEGPCDNCGSARPE